MIGRETRPASARKGRAGIAAVAATLTAVVAVTALVAPASAAKPFRLRTFDGCGPLVEYARAQADKLARPWGIEGIYYGTYHMVGEVPVFTERDGVPSGEPAPAPAEEPAAPAAPAGDAATNQKAEGVDFSGTNVQEQGVDEPDIVKTDGDRIFTIAEGKLQAVDASGPAPRLVGRLPLEIGWGAELFLKGNRVLVLSNGVQGPRPQEAASDDGRLWHSVPQGAKLVLVDVSNPAEMKVEATLLLDGYYVTARRIGDSVRVVVSTDPAGLDIYYPATEKDQDQALALNRKSIAESGPEAWIPLMQLTEGGETTTGPAVDCDDVRYPRAFSGVGMLNVLTIDLAKGLDPVDTDAVMTDGEVVYASTQNLYVTTTRWLDQAQATSEEDIPNGIKTIIHKFDIANPSETVYRASGAVRGFLTSQWSMSEWNGDLRVASTDAPGWWGWSEDRESESFVTVLRGNDGVLERIGRVGGLGKGEWIYAVRFIGDTGYVVTFRQTDPLYTIDLSNPTQPRVVGELKILGYSAYLHPIGDGLLLGVGQDADEEGRVKGTQVSVFDVSNPANPVRTHQLFLGRSWSEAEWDHHAFLYWPRTSLLVLPVYAYNIDEATGAYDYFSGAVGIRASGAGLGQIATITHPQREGNEWIAQIRRSLVIGDTLYTVSEHGLKASSLATLEPRTWLPF